jgi:hypothetical protein
MGAVPQKVNPLFVSFLGLIVLCKIELLDMNDLIFEQNEPIWLKYQEVLLKLLISILFFFLLVFQNRYP